MKRVSPLKPKPVFDLGTMHSLALSTYELSQSLGWEVVGKTFSVNISKVENLYAYFEEEMEHITTILML